MPANSSNSRTEPRHHRTAKFYGQPGFERIRQANITIIGLGGVGGHAAVNLARSGIGALHLVDFDEVTDSSLNRSPYAGPLNVGSLKTDVLAACLAEICPDTHVSITSQRCGPDNQAELVSLDSPARPDLVIDAIDSVQDKISLLAWCRQNNIPVLASMGAAGKRDVTLVRTGPIAETRVCPLAKQVRLGLRDLGVPLDIPCIWSLEKVASGRGGPLPSQMSLPGVLGYGLASLALDLIAREEK
ncbi:MAG: ThiF family adenylyltransferase [Gemmatimonadales bacterium]|nr:ThiF family adenylyltransferase [Gemmatimonadales bacterium]